jgi:hypothetical protein
VRELSGFVRRVQEIPWQKVEYLERGTTKDIAQLSKSQGQQTPKWRVQTESTCVQEATGTGHELVSRTAHRFR